MSEATVYHGTLVHSVSIKDLEIIENGVLVVNDQGVITNVEKNVTDLTTFLESHSLLDAKIQKLDADHFLVPGFVDTHAHAPQYVFAGCGMELQLLDWLETYTFPCESAFKDVDHATKVYEKVIRRFLSNGTTTCSWFATIHIDACQKLVDIIGELGQRAYVGKVNMDQNSPDYYIESTESSLEDTRAFIEYIRNKGNDLITPVITPRFAITCSSPLMNGLGELAEKYKVPIQSHLCENHNEINFTMELFKDSKDYTSVYDDHALLTERTYMAHCVHMTDDEIDLMAKRKTGVAHCPNSNFSLHSGVCDVRRFLSKGVKVGLGTDVAGGFSPSLLDAVRSTFHASKTQKIIHRDVHHDENYVPLSSPELLYLATLGGAQVLNLENKIGNFQEGKEFDALWVDLHDGNLDLMGSETPLQKVEKFLFNGNNQNLKYVFVQGRRVSGRN